MLNNYRKKLIDSITGEDTTMVLSDLFLKCGSQVTSVLEYDKSFYNTVNLNDEQKFTIKRLKSDKYSPEKDGIVTITSDNICVQNPQILVALNKRPNTVVPIKKLNITWRKALFNSIILKIIGTKVK